jgi:hypothetical protein
MFEPLLPARHLLARNEWRTAEQIFTKIDTSGFYEICQNVPQFLLKANTATDGT